MAPQPAVLPETFSGDGLLVDWLDHFEKVEEVNEWGSAAKALWLCACLVGRTQNAINTLSEEEKGNYTKAKERLME